MQTFKYSITCDEFPDCIDEDSINYYSNPERRPEEVAVDLAESYMTDVIYDWEGQTEPGDLFYSTVSVIDGAYCVTFFSNSPMSNSHIPDHTIVVTFS